MDGRRGLSGDARVAGGLRAAAGLALFVVGGCQADLPPLHPYGDDRGEEVGPVERRQSALLATDVVTGIGGNEPHLAVSPVDPTIVAVSQCSSIALSFDSGQSFLPSDLVRLQSAPGHGALGCDDVMTFDSRGRLFVEFLDFIPGGQTDLFVQQIDVSRSVPLASRLVDAVGTPCASGGVAAQCPINVTNKIGLDACAVNNTPGRSADRPWFNADRRPLCPSPTPARGTRTCSPFQDTLYVVWLDSPCVPDNPTSQTARVASSPDQGATWDTVGLRDPNATDQLWQYSVEVAANGDAYVAGHAASIGETAVFQSVTGTASGFGAATSLSIPFPAPTTTLIGGNQQCQCPGSVCQSNPSQACTFSPTQCPGTPGCECGAADDCQPASGCPNQPIPGWQLCTDRATTNSNFSVGAWSPYLVADPANPNNIAVFSVTDPNRGMLARDKWDLIYAVSTDATAGSLNWALANVTPGGTPLPATNQLFPQAASPIPGINGSCVTLAYYDDRNPLPPNGNGDNFLDVFVTVNPNLWGGRAWQAEKQVNHTPFEPDVGGGDRSQYCGGPLGCPPAGWKPQPRMGEYFGLAQAFGIAWTGNLFDGAGAPQGQQVLFNYTDAIAPIVTAPPATTIGSCTPPESALGTATATDECGMPPLGAPTSNLAAQEPLSIGPHTITWSVTDGANNTGSATQTVTVTDTTGPTFTIVPPDLVVTSCTGVGLGQAFAQDDCGGTVTITNNAPTRFPLGTTVVTWTARDARGNTRTATQRVTALLGDDASCCPAGTNVIVGTSNNDPLNGTNGADCILGRGGQDTINGNGGNDFISGGDGDDTINGGDGNDTIFAGSGQDTVNGGNGNDTLWGGDGDDHVFGNAGIDVLHGGQGQDTLDGGDDADTLFGDDGNDTLLGGNGDDVLAGGAGSNDTCNGGAGANIFEQCEVGGTNACADGVRDGTESGVDCGGGCPACGTGQVCASGNDCLSGICSAGLCQSAPGGVRIVAATQTDWGGGYCVALQVTNAASLPTANWTVTFNTNQTTIFNSWNGAFSSNAGVVTVTPTLAGDQVVSPGQTNADVGFCANRNVPNSGRLPIVTSATGSF